MHLPATPSLVRIFDFASKPSTHYAHRRVLPHHQEILILTEGSAHIRVDNQLTTATAGSQLWFHPGELLEAHTPAIDPFQCVVFLFHQAEPTLHAPLPLFSQWPSPHEARQFAREALAHFRIAQQVHPLFQLYCHTRLAWIASQCGHALQALSPPLPTPLAKALELLRTHYQDPTLTTAAIAKSVGISPGRLHQLCRAHLQTTPKQAILLLRIRHARDLLHFTRLSIKEITHAAGFHQPTHFCRAFKKATGQSPNTYRQNNHPDHTPPHPSDLTRTDRGSPVRAQISTPSSNASALA